jgi:hypothetical protein
VESTPPRDIYVENKAVSVRVKGGPSLEDLVDVGCG